MSQRGDGRGAWRPPRGTLGKGIETALEDFGDHLGSLGMDPEAVAAHVGRVGAFALRRRHMGGRGPPFDITPLEITEYMGIWFPIANREDPPEEVGRTIDSLERWCRYLNVRGRLGEGDLAAVEAVLDLVDVYEGRFVELKEMWGEGDPTMGDMIEWTADFDPSEYALVAAEAVPGRPDGVYAFKVWMKRRRGLWREIEVLGRQPLSELDGAIQGAFGHDWGHLSGFRLRGLELGPAEADGFDCSTDVPVSSLGLAPGDRFDYTYDFGDMHEHVGELLEVREREEAADYPRVARRNRPRRWYCGACSPRDMPRKDRRVARYICIECGLRLCGDCAGDHGDDEHWLEEIVY